MRQGPRVTFIIATIVSAAIAAFLPAVAVHAADVTVRVFRPPDDEGPICVSSASGVTAVTIPNPAAPEEECDSATGVTITAKSGTSAAQVVALTGASQNQVVIKNAVITNTGTGSVRVVIEGNNPFTSVNTNLARSYAIGLNVNFMRKNSGTLTGTTILACGDSISKQGFYTYFDAGCPSGQCTDQIGLGVGAGIPLGHLVPCAGSTTQNNLPLPAPSATELNRKCADFLASGGSCDTSGERLTTVATVTLLNTNDQVTIPSGDHTCAGPADNVDGTSKGCNAVLNSLTAVARLHQNTPNPRVNPFDSGHLTVELLCNPSFPCANVDQTSLTFGPDGAIPDSVKSKDVNGDGVADLSIKVAQQDTGIQCGDTTATLTGMASFPSVGDQEFNATVAFYTDPLLCP